MPISTPTNYNEIHPRKPLDNARNIGGDMSMIFFVRSRIVKTFTSPDDKQNYRIKGLNTECVAGIPFPQPTWITNSEYRTLRMNSENDDSNWAFFGLNLSIFNQTLTESKWNDTWFFMHGRVHPYALTWEVETDGDTANYTVPLLMVRDQGYQP
jgi:hypothetical protein